jgi:hypothetical protein
VQAAPWPSCRGQPTRPRPAAGISFRLLIREESIGCRDQVFVLREIVRTQGNAAQKLVKDFCPILGRKSIKRVKQLLGTLRHESRLAFNVFRVKFSAIPEV